MTITVDASTEDVRTLTTSPQTFSHGGAASGVKGVVLAIVHGTSSTDHVSAASYGGVAMSRKQRNTDTSTEPGAAEWWFLGSGVPQGTQTVSYTPGATTDDIHAVAITLLADGDTEVIDTDGVSENTANPSVTLQYDGRSAMAFGAFYGGGADPGSFAPNANCETVHDHDLGAFYSEIIRQTTAGTADFAIGGTSGTDDVAFAAIAVAEARVISPSQGAITVAGLAPLVVNSELNVTRTPDPAALAIAGLSQSVGFGFDIPAGSVLAEGTGPSVFEEAGSSVGGGGPGLLLPLALVLEPQPPLTVEPSAGTVVVAGYAPNFIAGAFMQPAEAALTIAGTVSSLGFSFAQPAGAVVLAGLAPSLSIGITRAPGVGSVTAAGFAPSLSLTLPMSVGALTASGLAPTISATGGVVGGGGGPGMLVVLGLNLQVSNITFSPAPAELQITTTVTGWGAGYTYALPAGTLAVAGHAPVISTSAGGQAPVMESPVALAITGHPPTIVSGKRVTFPFTAAGDTNGFVASSGPFTTMAHAGALGNPAGSLSTRMAGNSVSATNVWTLSSDWQALGLPAAHTIVGISLASCDSECAEFTNGTGCSVGQATLTPTGFPVIELAASRTFTGVEGSWTTNAGAGASGLQLPTGGSFAIRLSSTINTTAGGSPAVRLLQDNLTFIVSYVSEQTVIPPVRDLTITGHAPTVIGTAAEIVTPGSGTALIQGAGPTVQVTAPVTGGGGGPGALMALALNLEPRALGPATLVITGYAPAIFSPISASGSDDLISLNATATGSGIRIAFGSAIRTPANAALTITGRAPTLVQTGSRLFAMPVTALTITRFVPTAGIDFVRSIPAGEMAFSGLGPSVEPNKTLSPLQGSAQITGQVPVPLVSLTVAVPAGALSFAGLQPNPQSDLISGPFAGIVSAAGYAPFVSATDGRRFEPDVGAATIATYAPTLGIDHVREPGVASLTIDGLGPTVDVPPVTSFVVSPANGAVAVQGYEPLALVSVELATETGAIAVAGHAPSIEQSLPISVDSGALVIETYAPTVKLATWNGSGDIASQRATASASALVVRHGSGVLQSQQPLDFVGSGAHGVTATGTMHSGPASLQGQILATTAALVSGRATLKARAKLRRFKPHKPPKPPRVNRYNVKLKPNKRMKFRRSPRRPMK